MSSDLIHIEDAPSGLWPEGGLVSLPFMSGLELLFASVRATAQT